MTLPALVQEATRRAARRYHALPPQKRPSLADPVGVTCLFDPEGLVVLARHGLSALELAETLLRKPTGKPLTLVTRVEMPQSAVQPTSTSGLERLRQRQGALALEQLRAAGYRLWVEAGTLRVNGTRMTEEAAVKVEQHREALLKNLA